MNSYLTTLADDLDKIMIDLVGKVNIREEDLTDIVNYVVDTIFQFDQTIDRENLTVIIEHYITQRYTKCYVYQDRPVVKQTGGSLKIELDGDTLSFDDIDLDQTEPSHICTRYVCPELTEPLSDISHVFDYDKPVFTNAEHLVKLARVTELKKIPFIEQKSAQWLQQRTGCLTATAIATVLDMDPYKYPVEILLDKCGRGTPFVDNENTHHGKKYEHIGNMFYSYRRNVNVGEYGLLFHPTYAFIGASPDGICSAYTADKTRLSSLVGRLLEIKFPKRRRIKTMGKLDGDICPHYYWVQVQTQLFVTKLSECDFLQCAVEEYGNWDMYVADSATNESLSKKTGLERGCLIQLLPISMIGGEDTAKCLYNAKYIYPPKITYDVSRGRKMDRNLCS